MHGGPLSGYGTRAIPHALLCANRLSMTVSLRPPEIVIPVPVGPAAAPPLAGTLGLLLSWTKLSMKTQHEWVWVIGLIRLPGQAPSWGEGSSPFWLLVSKPSWLLSNSEFLMIRVPPEFEPE